MTEGIELIKFIVLLNNQPGVLLADTDVISSSNPGSLSKIPRDHRHIIEMLPLTLNKYLIQHFMQVTET